MKSLLENLEKFGKMPFVVLLFLLALAALYIVYDNSKSNQILLSNHLEHNTDALIELKTATIQNTEVLRSLKDIIQFRK